MAATLVLLVELVHLHSLRQRKEVSSSVPKGELSNHLATGWRGREHTTSLFFPALVLGLPRKAFLEKMHIVWPDRWVH